MFLMKQRLGMLGFGLFCVIVINGIYFVAIYPNATAMIPNTTLPAT